VTNHDSPNKPARVFIGLGSNLGDRHARLDEALELIEALPKTDVLIRSAFYETQPRFVEEQPDFLNAAACLNTTLAPAQLLEALLAIERVMGRVRDLPKGPRVIDLDILLYDDLVESGENLQIPHPGLAERAFVLVPMAEIAPELVHPVLGQTMAELALACPDTGWVVPAKRA
jgi:2-amino-4-hydroxy-6-hydroxymethyldihydropteridine diphosphokinase